MKSENMKKTVVISFVAIIGILLLNFCMPFYSYAEEMSLQGSTNKDKKAVIFRVGFEDYPLDGEGEFSLSREELIEFFEGRGADKYPYEGISTYYERSSYGLERIKVGEVTDIELSVPRSYYDGVSGSENEYRLINDILSECGDDITFSDNDLVYFFYNGPDTERGSVWWPHHTDSDQESMENGITLDDYILAGRSDTRVLIHETGHALGLSDLYGYEDYYTYDLCVPDMMSDNLGDHNSYSKYLMGWLDASNIEYVSSASGDKTIFFSPVDSNVADGIKLAIIAPEAPGEADEFFVAEYVSGSGNMSLFDGRRDHPEGFRIFHVYNDETGALKMNALTKDNTPGADFGVWGEGDAITPYTVPSTGFFENGEPLRFTGFSITDFVTGKHPALRVNFSDERESAGVVTFTRDDTVLSNMLELSVTADRPLTLAGVVYGDEGVRLEKNGERFPLIIRDDSYNATRFHLEYRELSSPLEPDTEYTLIFPEGTFSDEADGEKVPEVRLSVRTGAFTRLENISVSDISGTDESARSGLIKCSGKSAYISFTEKHGYTAGFDMIFYDGGQTERSERFFVELPEAAGNINSIKAQNATDGSILLTIQTSGNTYVQRLTEAGNMSGKLIHIPDLAEVIETGGVLKGLSVEQPPEGLRLIGGEGEYTGSIWTVTDKKAVSQVSFKYDAYISGGFFALGKDRYAIAGYSAQRDMYYADVYGSDDVFYKRIELGKDMPLTFAAQGNTFYSVSVEEDGDSEGELFVVTAYDTASGSFIKKRIEAEHLSEIYLSGIKLVPANWGYILFYRYSGRADEPLSRIMFLSKDFEQLGALTLPGGADFTADGGRAVIIWETGDERNLAWTEVFISDEKPKGEVNVISKDDVTTGAYGGTKVGGSDAKTSLESGAAKDRTAVVTPAGTGDDNNVVRWCIVGGAISVILISSAVLLYRIRQSEISKRTENYDGYRKSDNK